MKSKEATELHNVINVHYKKVEWFTFASLIDLYIMALQTDNLTIKRVTWSFNQAILKAYSKRQKQSHKAHTIIAGHIRRKSIMS
ncbi:hypothetical protein DPMN_091350 [Dreissena polymorpha]|uniref:Uncharacterized protein n=1 Tax=Dreissena polymorpha TaxID=45954 RepID=A0A9D4KZW1_DREPO|nr:hypothetical protein DPMN_091350 [Dreissena polymorpha]